MSEHNEIVAPGEDLWAGLVNEDGVPFDQHEYAEAVEKTRTEMGGKGPDADAEEIVRERFPSLDWAAAFKTDLTKVEWLTGQFVERGQQVSLVGDGKVGKSLFALDWAIRAVAGRSFLGDSRHDPIRIVYLDRENSLRDVVTRAQALGAQPEDLSSLLYKQFPQFSGTLDESDRAAKELVALALYHEADLVLLDTVSRFIGGKESDADTWLQLYQRVHVQLKAAGIAAVRLDHFGKDAERGARGSSAKNQDVDAVWELSRVGSPEVSVENGVETILTNLKLARTHTRTGLGEDLFTIVRRGERRKGGMWLPGRTRHELTDNGVVAQAEREISDIVTMLIAKGCPTNISSRAALKQWLTQNNLSTYSNGTMSDIVRDLKARA